MAFLLCGSEGGPGKENIYAELTKSTTAQCFGLRMMTGIKPRPKHMESFTVIITRAANGFGFSVTGSKPARVKAVKEGSTAYVAGLRKNDHVIKINGEDVSHYLAENVAKIVRQTENQIVLDVERESTVQGLTTRATSSPKHHQIPDDLPGLNDNLINLRLSYDELSEPEQDRQAAINKLCHCEKDFLAQMHSGIQRYCDPLRHSLISPAEHVTLFQNVEKLVALSEYHVNKLEEEAMGYCDGHDNSEKFIDAVGAVYLPNVKSMAAEFEKYCNGIKNAFRLLAELKDFEEFEDFLLAAMMDSNDLSLRGFLQKPLEHIKSVVVNVQNILTLTPLDHPDTDCLTQAVDVLKDTCNRINDNNTRRCMSMTSLISMSRARSPSENSRSSCEKSRLSFGSSRSSGRSSVSSSDILNCTSSSSGSSNESFVNSSGSSGIGSSLDPEVLDIQRRLVFSNEIPAFQLATATRHLIYAGHVTHVEGDRLYVILMSDLILLTKLEADERLLVADHPILLRDVINTDFTDNDCLEFSLTVETPIDEEWVEECDIIFTAPSMEQKYTWKNLLEQRLESSKVQWDFLHEDNFI